MADQQSIHDSVTDAHITAQVSTSAGQMPAAGSSSVQAQAPFSEEEYAEAFHQAEHGVAVAGPEDFLDDDGYGTDDDSAATTSLASSAREYIFENGWRYHAFRAGSYNFPNDEREQDREDLKHAMFSKLFNKKMHLAPIEEQGSNILDLGTGTGIWALEVADMYPDSTVEGIDLSPIQTAWTPPNLKFIIDDAESPWLWKANFFDLIHTRHTIQAFRDWPNLFRNAYNHLKPGGYIECQEIDHFPRSNDDTCKPDNPMVQYWDLIAQGLAARGVDFHLAPRLADMMREAGFTVTERIFFVPIGAWPKNRQLREVGTYWREVLMLGLEAIAMAPLTRSLGWRKEEVEVFCASVRKAYMDRTVHAYMPFHMVYGQKPYA